MGKTVWPIALRATLTIVDCKLSASTAQVAMTITGPVSIVTPLDETGAFPDDFD
jgi:hypothetical protein